MQPCQGNCVDCRGRHSLSIKSEKEKDFIMSLCTKLGTKTLQQCRAAPMAAPSTCTPGFVYRWRKKNVHATNILFLLSVQDQPGECEECVCETDQSPSIPVSKLVCSPIVDCIKTTTGKKSLLSFKCSQNILFLRE